MARKNRELRREYAREYYLANREQFLKKAAINRAANRERRRIVQRQYYAEHREQYVGYARLRKHRIRSANGDFSQIEWEAIVKRQRARCASCGEKHPLEIDHIIPISRGGCNFAFNIQGLCHDCNATKRAKFTTAVVSLFDRIAA